MNEIRFEEQEGFGVQPEYQYPLPGPDADRQFISFALSEEVRDPYSDVPRSVHFTRNQCFEILQGVDDEALDSIARKLGDQYISSAYLHMMVSAVYHRESPGMISDLDYFFADSDETRDPETWEGSHSATHDFLASAIRGMGQYRHLGFTTATNYRHADRVVREQAQALMTVTRLIHDDGRTVWNTAASPLSRSVVSDGTSLVTLSDDRMVSFLLRDYEHLAEIVMHMEERDSYDPEMLDEIMSKCSPLREGAL